MEHSQSVAFVDFWHSVQLPRPISSYEELSLDRVGKRWLVLAVAAGTKISSTGAMGQRVHERARRLAIG